MVAPEHLNWHTSLDDYIKAKSRLFEHQSSEDISIFFSGNDLSEKIASFSPGEQLPYFAPPGACVEDGQIKIGDVSICQTSQLKLIGEHNLQNVCAALTAVWQITQDKEAIRSVLTSFSGLEHRLELVREVEGVKYIDDSFGTTPETAVVAIAAFSEPKVLIVGGSDKGSDYTPLIETILKSQMRAVICIGLTGQKIAEQLRSKSEELFKLITLPSSVTMTDIVRQAQVQARSGDVVLLSTASASFDMFKNYNDRGEQFKSAVQSLAPNV
jgi:UDP-N-acetylmuramoylalanine--D-glutamate ligase